MVYIVHCTMYTIVHHAMYIICTLYIHKSSYSVQCTYTIVGTAYLHTSVPTFDPLDIAIHDTAFLII